MPSLHACIVDSVEPESGYNLRVVRAGLLALTSFALLTGSLPAQRAGHAGIAGVHSGFGGRGGLRHGSAPGFHRPNGASYFAPYFSAYDDSFGYGADGEREPVEPPVVIQRAPDPPIPNAQVIEVPAFASSSAPKVLPPPAIFILSSGERLESRRFVLTASVLSVSIDRQHRNVPLESIDLNATLAANHERGVDLRIPDDRNEISLGF